MGRELAAKRREAVLDLGRFGRIDHTQNEAVGLKRLKRVREHAFTHASDPACQLAEAMRLLQQQDQD